MVVTASSHSEHSELRTWRLVWCVCVYEATSKATARRRQGAAHEWLQVYPCAQSLRHIHARFQEVACALSGPVGHTCDLTFYSYDKSEEYALTLTRRERQAESAPAPAVRRRSAWDALVHAALCGAVGLGRVAVRILLVFFLFFRSMEIVCKSQPQVYACLRMRMHANS
jgi:hypothetical protein